jgi:hypothetical protein
LAFGLVLLTGIAPSFGPLAAQQTAAPVTNPHVLTLEVAADCRTFVNGANRADVSYGSGNF